MITLQLILHVLHLGASFKTSTTSPSFSHFIPPLFFLTAEQQFSFFHCYLFYSSPPKTFTASLKSNRLVKLQLKAVSVGVCGAVCCEFIFKTCTAHTHTHNFFISEPDVGRYSLAWFFLSCPHSARLVLRGGTFEMIRRG